MIDIFPNKIVWAYSEWQKAYEELISIIPNIEFIEGMPSIEQFKKEKLSPKLLILDDMMDNAKESSMNEMFTKGSHHWNLSIIHIVQNVFYAGLRTSRINAQYLILMKNPSDRLQVQTLGRQLFTGTKHFQEAFDDATEKPYGYLLIDLTQSTPDKMRLRTNIFPTDDVMHVYVPK